MTDHGRGPRTLLLTLVFAPDGVSTAIILTELARQLRAAGQDVVVITTTPHYNVDVEARRAQPLSRRWGRMLFTSSLDGIPVFHVAVREKGRRVLSRLFDYVKFQGVGMAAAPALAGAYDVVLAPSPPLTIGLSAWLLASWRQVPFVYNVQEIYPDIAVSLGVLRNRAFIAALEWFERFIYGRAARIVVISERFRTRLLQKGVPESKLHVIPNFVDTSIMAPGPRDNAFAREHGLTEKFVVLYAGNLGLTQDFEVVFAAAARLRQRPDILFLIVGDGARAGWIAAEIGRRGATNVRRLPYQPRGRVPELYASADVGIIPMQAATAHDTFPSKIYTIMAAARPAIAGAEADSELAHTIAAAKAGRLVPPGDERALADAVAGYADDPARREVEGRRGRDYVLAHHSPAAVGRLYAELLRDVAAHRRGP